MENLQTLSNTYKKKSVLGHISQKNMIIISMLIETLIQDNI